MIIVVYVDDDNEGYDNQMKRTKPQDYSRERERERVPHVSFSIIEFLTWHNVGCWREESVTLLREK
jgi:hypothetical protein